MLKSGLYLFCGTIFGRALGLFREIVMASEIGANTNADIIIALVTLPDILINIFIGNAFAAVFVPKIKALEKNKRFGYHTKLSLMFLCGFALLTFIGLMNIGFLSKLILPSQADSGIFQSQLKVVLFTVPLLALNMVSRTFLQSEERFALMGLEGAIFNFCILFGLYLFIKDPNFEYISATLILGATLRWFTQLTQIIFLYKIDWVGFSTSVTRKDVANYQFAFFTGVLSQVLPLLCRSIVSYYQGVGGLSVFNYTFKFIEFPMAIGVSIISVIIFPILSENIIQANHTVIENTIRKTQDFILSFCLPLSIFAPIFAYAYAGQIPAFRNLSIVDMQTIVLGVGIGTMVFWFRGLNELANVIFNSFRDVRRPLINTSISAAVVAIFTITSAKYWGVEGAILGMSLGYIVLFILNAILLRKIHRVDFFDSICTKENIGLICLNLAIGAFLFVMSYVLSWKQGALSLVMSTLASSIYLMKKKNIFRLIKLKK